MSTIITKGYGLSKQAIITQGYGRSIEAAVVRAIERLRQRRIGGSRKEEHKNEKQEECITIFASLIEANDKILPVALSNEIQKCFIEDEIDINVKSINVSYLNDTNLKVEVVLKSAKTTKSNVGVSARIPKKKS